MNILVTGANGRLGLSLRKLSNPASSNKYLFSDIRSINDLETIYLDITDIEAVRIICGSEKPDVIINCASFSDEEKAEREKNLASVINSEGAKNLASVCRESGAFLIHISSDYIFGNKHNLPIKENETPYPSGIYGETKYSGEQNIIRSKCKYIIIRTSGLYSETGDNFVRKILDAAMTNKEIYEAVDRIGTPTYASDLAAVILKMVEENLLHNTGTYNYSNEGAISAYDFAKAVVELSETNCKVLPCLSEKHLEKTVRPVFTVLDKEKIKTTFGIEIPYWRDSLSECLKHYRL